jgi:HPt (histidine-containing phosphotransfer) domain-containing protein
MLSAPAPPPPAPHAKALIDDGFLHDLLEELGADVLVELVQALDEEVRAGFTTLESAALAEDAQTTVACLHGLRGAALAVGLSRFAGDVARLEARASAGCMPRASDYAQLAEVFDASRTALGLRVG